MPLNLAISRSGKLLRVKGKPQLQTLVPWSQERRVISTGISTGCFPLLRPRFTSASGNPGQRCSAMQTSTLWPVIWRCPRLILTRRNGLMSIRVQSLHTVCISSYLWGKAGALPDCRNNSLHRYAAACSVNLHTGFLTSTPLNFRESHHHSFGISQ